MKELPIANCRLQNHFPDAVFRDAAMIAVRSFDSFKSAESFCVGTIFDSINNSIHNAVSSASSSTVPILEMNSARLRSAARSPIICRHGSPTADNLFCNRARSIIVFRNGAGQFDNPQSKDFCSVFQFDWVHALKL